MGMVSYPAKMNQGDGPLCSVCIANYNGEDFIEQCINSVLQQENFPGSVEIIIHDDASIDNSVSLIETRYPQVCLLLSKYNVGYCISNNKMVSIAQGKFILLLNNDAVLYPNALKSLYDASQEYGEGIYGLPQYDAATGELIDIGSTFDLFLNPIPNKNPHRDSVGMVIGACLWLPRNLWDNLGGFPEWFGSLAEDMYLCCLARLKGNPVKVISTSKFSHWVGRSIGGGKVLKHRLSTTLTRRAMSERNKTFVMLICYPQPIVWLIIPVHLIILAIEGILITMVKNDKRIWLQIYWFCLKEVWNNRVLWVKQRRAVQGVRQCNTCEFLSPFTLLPHKVKMFVMHGMPDIR